jgi:hypothetical protein
MRSLRFTSRACLAVGRDTDHVVFLITGVCHEVSGGVALRRDP